MRYRPFTFAPLVFAVGLIAGVALSSLWRPQGLKTGLGSEADGPTGSSEASSIPGDTNLAASIPPASLPPAESSSSTGFQMRFVQGDISNYRIDTVIRGKGFEAGGFGGVETRFVSDFSVFTKELAADNSADMRVSFDNAQLTGSFMDVPFEMGYTPERSYMFYGNTNIDTANSSTRAGSGPFEYFSKPISVRVAPNGTVQKIEGSDGMASLLSAVPSLSFVEYPGETIQQGKQWESRFALPVPGFGGSVQARVANTFWGYQQMGGRTCGVIQQSYATDDAASGSSLLNSEGGIDIAMPTFDLNGQGLVYFDVTDGKLVHTTLNLQLTMGLSKALGGLEGILSTLTQDPASLSEGSTEQSSNLLDLMLTIEGAITLVDAAASAPPQ